MSLDEPSWWYRDQTSSRARLTARLLEPAARLYARLVESRFTRETPYRSRLPVICVGNFTAGGTGKTPTTQHIVGHLMERGERPVILSRGYGGRLTGPVLVDPARHGASDVGDEPLLLCRKAPVVISARRDEGARYIESGALPATVIVMDDGMQNPGLAKNVTIALVDAARGFGNGKVIPAGPLRAALGFQLALAGCIVIAGEPPVGAGIDEAVLNDLAARFKGPILRARTRASGSTAWLKEAPVIAYAGIANPSRFFQLVEREGGKLAGEFAFRDHREFREADADHLLAAAASAGAQLVTTEKDLARLAGSDGLCARLRGASRALTIELYLDDDDRARLHGLIDAALADHRAAKNS